MQILARSGTDNKDEIREKTIHVTKWTYDELREIGKTGTDFDDVITKLLKEYNERQKGK
jgi:predicted CopG family antitoxin